MRAWSTGTTTSPGKCWLLAFLLICIGEVSMPMVLICAGVTRTSSLALAILKLVHIKLSKSNKYFEEVSMLIPNFLDGLIGCTLS